MKLTSVIKRIDNLGRIVLPKDVRKKLKIKENDELEIIIGDDDSIILRKYSAIDEYERECNIILNILENLVNGIVAITDNSNIRICGKKENQKYIGLNLSKRYINILSERKIFNERIMPSFNIVDDMDLYAKAIVPIISDSVVTGSIVIFSEDKKLILREKDIELLKFASSVLSKKMRN